MTRIILLLLRLVFVVSFVTTKVTSGNNSRSSRASSSSYFPDVSGGAHVVRQRRFGGAAANTSPIWRKQQQQELLHRQKHGKHFQSTLTQGVLSSQAQALVWTETVDHYYTDTNTYTPTTTTADQSTTKPKTATAAPVVAENKDVALNKLDAALFISYFCTMFTVTLPIILLPYIAAERQLPAGAFTATMASVSALWAGVGKLLNGFVCQKMGGSTSSMIYHIGLATSTFLLACGSGATTAATNTARNVAIIKTGCFVGAMEFFASIQWTANSLILFNHYLQGNNRQGMNRGHTNNDNNQQQQQQRFARGVSIVTLASTSSVFAAKLGATFLLQKSIVKNWRSVAYLGTMMAILGAIVVRSFVSEHPMITKHNNKHNLMRSSTRSRATSSSTRACMDLKNESKNTNNNNNNQSSSSTNNNMIQTFKQVLGNPLFWQLGFAHATVFLARTSDKIMGAFFEEVTSLPRHVCGGSTAVITLGFVHGLYKGSIFHKLNDIPDKVRMLSNGYISSVRSSFGLALLAHPWFRSKILFRLLASITTAVSPPVVIGLLVAFLTGSIASSLSFQFYQVPQMVSNTSIFKQNKAVCISLLDGMGFFLSAIVWAFTSRVVRSAGSSYGWSLIWILMGTFFGMGGTIMTKKLPLVLSLQQKDD